MVIYTALSEAKALLLQGKELSGSDIENLNTLLHRLKIQELKMLAKEVHVRLTGSFRKDDIIKRIMGMARIGALQRKSDVRFDDIGTISYVTEIISEPICKSLPDMHTNHFPVYCIMPCRMRRMSMRSFIVIG